MTLELVASEEKVAEVVEYRIEIGERSSLEPDVDDDVMERCILLVRNFDRLHGPLVFPKKQYRSVPWATAEKVEIQQREEYILGRVSDNLERELEAKVQKGELDAEREAPEWRSLVRILLILGLFRLHLKLEHLTWLCVQTGFSYAEVHRFGRNARQNREHRGWLAS